LINKFKYLQLSTLETKTSIRRQWVRTSTTVTKNKNEVFAEWWKLVGNSGWAVLVRGWRKLKVE
jgi:hypothetical protein